MKLPMDPARKRLLLARVERAAAGMQPPGYLRGAVLSALLAAMAERQPEGEAGRRSSPGPREGGPGRRG